MCILCRKKQELLIKTGQWIHSSMANKLQQLEAESFTSSETPLFDKMWRTNVMNQSRDHQPMNLFGIGRRGSLSLPADKPSQSRELRRQFSHGSQPPPQSITGWNERSQYNSEFIMGQTMHNMLPMNQSNLMKTQRFMPDIPQPLNINDNSTSLSHQDLLFRNENECLLQQGTGRRLPRQRSKELWELTDSNVSYGEFNQPVLTSYSSQQLPKQLPVITLEQKAKLLDKNRFGNINVPFDPNVDMKLFSSNGFSTNKNYLGPNAPVNLQVLNHPTLNNRRRSMAEIRTDSLSSDQSECVRPPPPKPHKPKAKIIRKLRHYNSLSSSDDEIHSTPGCSTEEDQEFESESISERGLYNEKNFKCQRIMRPEEILDAKIKNFLAVSFHMTILNFVYILNFIFIF